jgi:hypothetical protein
VKLPEGVETPDGLSVQGASAFLLEQLLPEFEDELRRAGVPVEKSFAPGIGRAEVNTVFERMKLPAPEEAVVWFGWHNGVTALFDWSRAFPRFEFYSIGDVERRYLDENGWPHGHEEWQWNPQWLQLLGDNNGLAVECVEPRDRSPRVRPISNDGEWGTQPENGYSQVVSLSTPVTWWIESLRKGEYAWYPEQRAWDWDFQKPYDRPEKRVYI